MKYMTIKEASKRWNMSERRIWKLCSEQRIRGAQKFGWLWSIPQNTSKPHDVRRKHVETNMKVKNYIQIERFWSMPNKNTFDIKPIKNLINQEMTKGTWIDPFANKNRIATITNDLSNEFATDYHLDALDFLRLFDDNSIDGVLYDPPFSPRQVSECYRSVGYNVTCDTTKASFWGNHKREIQRIVRPLGCTHFSGLLNQYNKFNVRSSL